MVALLPHDAQSNRGQLDHPHIIPSISNTSSESIDMYMIEPVIVFIFSVMMAF